MPTTWELPVAAGLAWAAVAAVLLPAGQGAASWLSGGGWLWPRAGAGLTASVGGLLAGHPGAGLAREAAAALPRPWVVYLLLALVQAAWLSAGLLGLRAWWRTRGPGMRQGLASRGEVERVLGRSRLRRDRAVIRPDLYAKAPATRRRP